MKKKGFIIYSILIIITRILDGYTTFLATPDLSDEANPIINLFLGRSWFLLILVGTIFTVAVLIGFYFSYKNQNNLIKKTDDYFEYIGFLFYDKKVNCIEFFYRPPLSKSFFVFVGLSFSISLFFYSLLVIINNVFVLSTYHNSFCYNIYFSIDKYFTPIFIFTPILICLLVSFFIIKRSFNESKKM